MKYKRDDAFLKQFGRHLKELRKKKHITQEELAYRTEMELSQIGRIERGTINTSISNVHAIALALETTPAELFNF